MDDPSSPKGERGEKRTRNLTVSLYEGDHELVEWLVAYLGTNRSDVVRTAIRMLAVHLQAIRRKR